VSKLGERVMDARITISADPMDPEMGFPPGAEESFYNQVYHPVTWIERGILKALAYRRDEAIANLNQSLSILSSGAFRMSGGPTTIAEMIATTARGLLVTRFHGIRLVDERSQLYTGYTRDGVWLIEQGKISKPVKNLKFTESVLWACNNVEQLGPPQRVFQPGKNLTTGAIPTPTIVPPMKVRDFSFTGLSDAI
jgi:predicted Zn-dependent protease